MICALYDGIADEKILVLNNVFCEEKWAHFTKRVRNNMICIMNSEPERDRIYSLKLGATSISADRAFVHNIDQPQLPRAVLSILNSAKSDADIVLPTNKGKAGHPVLLSKRVLDDLRFNNITSVPLNEYFSQFSKEYVEVNSDLICQNINTLEDFDRHFHTELTN